MTAGAWGDELGAIARADERVSEAVARIEALALQRGRGAGDPQGKDAAETETEAHLTGLVGLLAERCQALAVANEQLDAQLAEHAGERERERRVLAEAATRVEHTQNQLLQSEKLAAVGQLAAGVAHEINNPVGFVSSNLGSLTLYVNRLFSLIDAYERLEIELPADHPARTAVQKARTIAEIDYLRADIPDLLRESLDGLARIRHIVADLKDFSHADEGEWQDADLNRGLESTLNIVWNEIKYKAEVVRELDDLPPVRCIPAQMNQVFMNLLVNAAQAIETSGTITLRSGTMDGYAWVEIADTGKGMPPEVQQRIFEPFFTTKPVGKGTGLGLSISADIVRRHDGRIEIRSQPGRGTTFRILLPLRVRDAGAAGSKT
ncbi:ATP-binding protein [Azoarcus sp. PA01]|nr:ATP-binding protein [Azoarcus sp. PA01]